MTNASWRIEIRLVEHATACALEPTTKHAAAAVRIRFRQILLAIVVLSRIRIVRTYSQRTSRLFGPAEAQPLQFDSLHARIGPDGREPAATP